MPMQSVISPSRRRDRWRGAVVALMVLASLLLAGCATGPLPRGPVATAAPAAASGPLHDAVTALGLAPGESAYRLVAGGEDGFVLRYLTAQRASTSIDAQYYMWHDDLTGRLLAGELFAAAERGVRVRVLVDDLYAQGLEDDLANLDAHPLLEIRVFNPFRARRTMLGKAFSFLGSGGALNHRMHNKLWIADGSVAVVGGRNIGDEYFGANDRFNFGDLGVLLAGRAVTDASAQFDTYWNSDVVVPLAAFARVTDADAAFAEARAAFAEHRDQATGTDYARHLGVLREAEALGLRLGDAWRGNAVTMLADDPAKAQRGRDRPMLMLRAIEALLQRSEREAVVVSPYFVPRRYGTDALTGLVGRGAAVAVLTNSLAANDVAAVHGGYSRWRRPLLEAGVVVHELKPIGSEPVASSLGSSRASLHTKAVVVDRRLAYVGSFNFDPRSAQLNTESGVLIDDPRFAAAVLAQYEAAIAPARSWRVHLVDGRMRWTSEVDGRELTVDHEPDASLGRRMTALLFRILPLDSQL
jgi:putative cardiolipin synthase